MNAFKFQGFQVEPVENTKFRETLEVVESEIIRDGFVILPERLLKDPVEGGKHEIFDDFMSLSRHVTLIAGSLLVKDNDCIYNRSYVYSHGKILGYQDKIVPFSREKSRISPGRVIKVFTADSLTFSVAVCYDLDFPFYAKLSALNGSRMIFNPSLIRADFHEEWHMYVRARGLENRVSVLSVNSKHNLFQGDSIMVNPYVENDGVRLEVEEYGGSTSFTSEISARDIDSKYRMRIEEDPGIYSFPVKKVINQ